MTSTDAATIVVAEGEPLSRSALADVIGSLGLRVVGEAGDAATARAAVLRQRPDLLLVDVDLGGPGAGIAIARRVREDAPGTAVLAVADVEGAHTVLALLEAGALGYVPRNSDLSQFARTLGAALRGEPCLPRRILGDVLASLLERRRIAGEVDDRYGRLSSRERQVLGLLSRGADNGDIARELFISPETVRTHVQNVLGKLRVHSRVEAAALAVTHGLVDDGSAA